MTLFDRIKLLSKKRGKNLKQVAFDIGLGENYFYTLKKQSPKAETLQIIADYFNVSVDYLLGREKEQEFAQMEPEKVNGFLRVDLSGVPEEDKDDVLEELNWYKEKLIERAIKEAKKRNNGHIN